MQPFGNNLVIILVHRHGTDDEVVRFCAGRIEFLRESVRHDARLAIEHLLADFTRHESDSLGVPLDLHRRVIAGPGRLDNARFHAGDLSDPVDDVPEPLLVLAVLIGDVACRNERLHCRNQPHHLFFADLERPCVGVVRRAADIGGVGEVLAVAQQQPAGLRPLDALAAAVDHEVDAARKKRVGDQRQLGRGVHQDRHAMVVRRLHERLERDTAVRRLDPLTREGHERLRSERALQIFRLEHIDHLRASHPGSHGRRWTATSRRRRLRP